MTSRRGRVILLGLVVIPIVIQMVALDRFDDLRIFPKYWQLAGELASGEISRDRLNDVSPLYLWFVTIFQFVSHSATSLRIVQLAMNGGTALLAAAVAWRVAGPVAAGATALFLMLNQALFINATELEPEALIALLNAAALYFLFGRDVSRPATFAAGMFFGLSAAARLVVLPAAVLTGAVAIWRVRAITTRPAALATFFLSGLAIPILSAILVTFALTGTPSIMNPGTVFYEGWNPHTSGYALTEPLIVSDVRAGLDAPDPLHLAYRLIAARITGEPPSPELANRFWTNKAFRYIETFPRKAAHLATSKLFFSIHSYDAWDLAPVVRRYRQSSSIIWIPFGLIAALAGAALIGRPREPAVIALWLYSLSYIAVMVGFYVTSRQRNAMLPAIAILAGIGLVTLASRLRHDRRAGLLWMTLAVLLAVVLTRTYQPQAENAYQWTAAFNSEAVVAQRNEAQREGRTEDEMRLRAIDRVWILGDDPHIPSAPKHLVAAIAKGELSQATTPQRFFDLAIALQYAGEWQTSEGILAFLAEGGYRPVRQAKSVDSVAYYRSLAALHTGDLARAREHLEHASVEDLADPNILAMRMILLGDEAARELLFRVHDRYTGGMAVARAYYETGNIDEALRTISAVAREIPEWPRARLLEAYLTDLSAGFARSQASGDGLPGP